MVKTQVQIPDHLYTEAKRVSKDYEMSFAEVVRRGLERIVTDYPPRLAARDWQFPQPEDLGYKDFDDEMLKRLAQEEEPRL
ncbi:MAG: antitoxin [Verrucomicrobiota bacterium JB022]|nr:antitoxin [Verrucomicrobiota bacterium JB022]